MNLESPKSLFNFSSINDLTAIIKPESTVSYSDLFFQANKIASLLSKNRIKKNNYIPLLIEDNFLFIKTVIGLWYLGGVPVPLNIKLLDAEINSILGDYNFKFLITDKELPSHLKKTRLEIIEIDKIAIADLELKPNSLPSLEDEAVVIFTSGSTGTPKGVVHTFSSLINSVQNGNQILNHQKNDRWIASLPFYHIGGFQIICRSLFYGCSIILPQSLQTDDLAKSIREFSPTHISLVSVQLERLIHQKFIPVESLRVSLIGGGFVEDELMIKADKLGWKPYRVYGSSETASMVTTVSSNEIKAKPQSAGKALNNVEIRISNESEILIKSDSLFKYYLNDEKETESKMVNGFYHTGDLGFVDDDGYLFIEARRNDLIVTGGENVNPLEVEKALLKIPFVKDACVFPKQNKTWGQIVASAIVCHDSSVDGKFLREILKQNLAGYKIPKEFYFVDKLPKTSLGKLERNKIRKMF